MSLGYSIASELDLAYTSENIQTILEIGQGLGILYYKSNENSDNFFDITLLPSVTNAVNYLLYEKENEYDSLHYVTAKLEETIFNFHILNDAKIIIMFNGLGFAWSKKFIGQEKPDLDIQRYTKLMLDIIKDFKIKSLVVEKG